MLLSLLIGIPLAVLVAFLADPIAVILFPKRHQECRDIIQITVWWLPLLGISQPLGTALQASERHVAAARTGMIAACISMPVTIALVWKFGIFGACSSLILRQVVLIAVRIPIVI